MECGNTNNLIQVLEIVLTDTDVMRRGEDCGFEEVNGNNWENGEKIEQLICAEVFIIE